MSRWQVLLLHISALAVTVTGVVLAWMKYGMRSDDPFAVVNHPWQSFFLHAHIVVAPLLLFGFGVIFTGHVLFKIDSEDPARRRSGLISTAMMAGMVLSGYFLQVATEQSTRQSLAIGHWVTSGVFVLAYVVHLLTKAKG